MLFATDMNGGADDGVVQEDEWRTLLSHARADRVKLAKRLRTGMSTKALEALDRARRINLRLLKDTGLMSLEDWEAARSKGRTSAVMSEMLARYIRIHAMAVDIWGEDKATVWLQRKTRALDGETPLSLLDTEQGARAVEILLGQIEHGIAS